MTPTMTPTLTPDDITRLRDVVRDLERLDARLLGRGDAGYCLRDALESSRWALAHAERTTEATDV
jgi:hypothetical protein